MKLPLWGHYFNGVSLCGLATTKPKGEGASVANKYYREDYAVVSHSLDPTTVSFWQSKVFRPKTVDSFDCTWFFWSHIHLEGGIVVVMIVILMGVSGSGKTTIGKRLAERLGWGFFEGDEFHPQENIAKMGKGVPLTDQDRQPWLAVLNKLIRQLIHKEESAVIACSALKAAYREILKQENKEVCFVYLKGDYDLIEKRLEDRSNHYMKAGLLSSQFADLQEPEGVMTMDIRKDPEEIVRSIQEELRRPKEMEPT